MNDMTYEDIIFSKDVYSMIVYSFLFNNRRTNNFFLDLLTITIIYFTKLQIQSNEIFDLIIIWIFFDFKILQNWMHISFPKLKVDSLF